MGSRIFPRATGARRAVGDLSKGKAKIMETRANFVLIGAFTLFGILGALGFFLWLAKVEVDRQYAYYDVVFTDVSGLGEAGDVRYNGLPVGQVVRLSLDKIDPSKVRVRIEVNAAIAVKTDTEATLELQGVTGVSYVSLSGGSPEAARLQAAPGEKVPMIVAKRSAFQSLFVGAPELLSKAIVLLEDIDAMVNPENRAAVGNVLGNLERASGNLNTALEDFSTLSADLSKAATRIAVFTDHLDGVADSARPLTTEMDSASPNVLKAILLPRPASRGLLTILTPATAMIASKSLLPLRPPLLIAASNRLLKRSTSGGIRS